MTVRGQSHRATGPGKRQHVAGAPRSGRRNHIFDARSPFGATSLMSHRRTLTSGAPQFCTRVAGRGPKPVRPAIEVDVESTAPIPEIPETPLAPVLIHWSFPVASLPYPTVSRRTLWQRRIVDAVPRHAWLSPLAASTKYPLVAPLTIVAGLAVLVGLYVTSSGGVYRSGSTPARQALGAETVLRPAAAEAAGVQQIYRALGVRPLPTGHNAPVYAIVWDPVRMTAVRVLVPSHAADALGGDSHSAIAGGSVFIPGATPVPGTVTTSDPPVITPTQPAPDPTTTTSSEPAPDPTPTSSEPAPDPTSDTPTADPTSDTPTDPTIDPATDATTDPTTDATTDVTTDPTTDPTIDPPADPPPPAAI
jgi:hypothetical protein